MKKYLLIFACLFAASCVKCQSAWTIEKEYADDHTTVADTIFPSVALHADSSADKQKLLGMMKDPVIFDSIQSKEIFVVRSGYTEYDYYLLIKKKKNWLSIPLVSFHGSLPLSVATKKIYGIKNPVIILTGTFNNNHNYDQGNISGSYTEETQLLQLWNIDNATCILNQVMNEKTENINRELDNKNKSSEPIYINAKGNSFFQQTDLTIKKKKLLFSINCKKQKVDLSTNENVNKTIQVKIGYKFNGKYFLRESASMITL